MHEAYKILGYQNPYHFSEIYRNVQDADMWIEALNAKYKGRGTFGKEQFDQLLGHCSVTSDDPANMLWRDLVAIYPDAKIVLIDRDEDRWYESWNTMNTNAHGNFITTLLAWTDPFWFGRIQKLGHLILECRYGSRDLEVQRQRARAAFRNHYAEIRATVPSERILTYQLGTGWEPLCKFLGKDIPDVPFPRRNEAEAIVAVFDTFAAKAMRHSIINLSVVIGISAIGGMLSWRWRISG